MPSTPKEKYKVNQAKMSVSLLAGSLAGAIEAVGTQFFAVNRLRVQTKQAISFNPSVIYRGVYSNMSTMAAMIAIRLSVRNSALRCFQEEDLTMSKLLGSAFVGGVATSPISSAVELGMTHQQKIKSSSKAPSVPSTLLHIARLKGPARLMIGMPLVAGRDGCFAMGFMGLAPILKHELSKKLSPANDLALSVSAGIAAGLFSAVISHPFDRVKTAQHANALLEGDNVSAVKIIRSTMKNEGLKGFYTGLMWRGARVTTGVALLAYITPRLSDEIAPFFKNNL